MLRRMDLTLLLILSVASAGSATASGQALALLARGGHQFSYTAAMMQGSDREQDGLLGPVRRIKTETAKITVKNAKPLEGPRVLLETTTYDNKGAKIDNAYFLAAGGSLTGKEVYKYDDKGNIVEMTLTNEDGSLQAKEVYSYEFDDVGNWTKMTTSVAMIEGGKLSYEPTEVTYRSIAYYLDEAMIAKMSQPAAQPAPAATSTAAAVTPSPVAAAPSNANAGAQPKAPAAATPAPANGVNKTATVAANKNAAVAPLNIASADKPIAAAPLALAANSNSSAAGPMVKTEGEVPAAPHTVRSGPLKPVSGGILNGKALKLPSPIYPEFARRSRLTGVVEVEVVIDVTGKVISATAVKGPALLRGAAEQAAKGAKFSPTLLSGQPVKITGTISYNFNLAQ